MDSFYDAPRRPPAALSRETLSAVPVVPEISVLCSSNVPRNAFTPYNQWKQEQQTSQRNFLTSNKENFSNSCAPQNSSILKKQVRFEGPTLQQQPLEIKKADFAQNSAKPPSHNNIPVLSGGGMPSFEQMYMANIPNRQLDLSIIDLPKRQPEINKINDVKDTCQLPKEKETPKTYKEFLHSKKDPDNIVLNDSVTDIFNYKGNVCTIGCNSPKVPLLPDINQNQNTEEMNTELSNQTNYTNPYGELKARLKDKNSKSVKSEEHFQSVSQAISQRSPYKPLESPNSYEMPNFNLATLERQSDPVIEHFQKSKICPKEQPNRVFTLSDRELSENSVGGRIYETQSGDNIPRKKNLAKEEAFKTYASIMPKKCDCCATSDLKVTENNTLKPILGDDFSVRDLLKIISQQSQQIVQQNSQILLLQQQVTDLIAIQKNGKTLRHNDGCQHQRPYFQNSPPDHNMKQISDNGADKCCLPGGEEVFNSKNVDRCVTSTQHEIGNRDPKFADPSKNKNHLPNFSIGLTTSFEVSFRRPTHRNPNECLQKTPRLLDYEPEPPRIQEITETESTKTDRNWVDEQKLDRESENDIKETLVDASMVFKEPIRVREHCPSPEPSIKINMNDFEDSDSDDGSTQDEASFYRNLMAQVNKILQKAQIETAEELACNMAGSNLNNKTMHKVKEATLRHLRRIGVNLPNIEENSQNSSSSDETEGKSYDQEDISFAVKQLLMKYLPAEHLAKLAKKEGKRGNQIGFTPKERVGAIKSRPEFSFATVQYMKKYNLITNSQKDCNHYQPANPSQSPKILDITKLKQQPKLI